MRAALYMTLALAAAGCPSRSPDGAGEPVPSRLVAVGEGGAVALSEDGVSWTAVDSPTDEDLRAVTYGDGTFVAVGAQGTILWSRGGSDWHRVQSLAPYELHDVAWDGAEFVAVGGDWEGGAVTLASPDGAAWGGWEAPATHVLLSVVATEDGLVASGFYLSDLQFLGVFVAAERAWVSRFTGEQPGGAFQALAHGDGQILGLVGSSVWRSGDAADWESHATPLDGFLVALAYGDGRFVAYDERGAAAVSSDGAAWTASTDPPVEDVGAVTFDGARFVTVTSPWRDVAAAL